MNVCDEETPLPAHIKHLNSFDIIVEHNSEKSLTASVCRDIENHCNPVAVYRTDGMELFEKTLWKAVKRAEREAAERRFSYYAPLWENEYIEVR